MLVVIAIIALLSAIIVPAISSALDRARIVKGGNTIRKWGNGMLLYSTDHNGKLVFKNAELEDTVYDTWQDRIAKIVIDENATRFILRNTYRHPNAIPGGWGYGATRRLRSKSQTDQQSLGYLHQIQNPSQSMLLVDFDAEGIKNVGEAAYDRNNGKAYFFFADGHVALFSPEQAEENVIVTGHN
jgi:prepilin-type processing-associated H-X9-DG protein